MKKRFPMLANWIRIRRTGPHEVEIINDLIDFSFFVDDADDYVSFITSLDGKTDPFEIPAEFSAEERSDILEDLSNLNALRKSRWLDKSLSILAYSLYFPKKKESTSMVFNVLNRILYYSFLPVFVCGILFCYNSYFEILGVSIYGIICGVFLGLLLHEAAHAISALSYGGRFLEAGICITHFLLPGAYVLCKVDSKISLQKQAQALGAGIEMNAIIAGIFFFLTPVFRHWESFFYTIALINLGMVFVNLIIIKGSDGYKILSLFFATEDDLLNAAIENIVIGKKRKLLMKQGLTGRITLYSYCVILVNQVAIPVLIVLGIWGIIQWTI